MDSTEMCNDRKFRKPMMEKKRRARINESLENLKQILLECDPESVNKKNSKLEKADILEMTVKYLQSVKNKAPSPSYYKESSYGNNTNYSTMNRYGGYPQNFVPTPFNSNSRMYYGSSSYGYQKLPSYKQSDKQSTQGGIWRPW